MGLIGTAIQVAMTARENAKQRKFAERMSNTAYQRTMKDMRKAGLNPILAYQKGGASTPTAGGTGFKTDIDIAGTAMQVAQGMASIDDTKQREMTSAQIAKTIEQDRVNALPGQQYTALQDEIKLGLLKKAVSWGSPTGKELTIVPDYQGPGTGKDIYNRLKSAPRKVRPHPRQDMKNRGRKKR